MLKIRLARVGKRNSPIFRLVVAEKSRAVKRENLEILGLYNPTLADNKFQANKERVLFWISKGAQPSLTANNLLCDFGILAKNQKIKNTFGKPKKKKDMKEEKESTTQTADTEKTQNETSESAENVEKSDEPVIETEDNAESEKPEKIEESEINNNVETTQVGNTEETQK